MPKKAKNLRLTVRPDGVAVVTFDTPGSPVNVLSSGLLAEVEEMLDTIEKDPRIKAGVLFSAKPDTFIAGANLEEVLAMKTEKEASDFSRRGQALLNRLEDGRKPYIAAIHGAALGGGLEVALACHYRIATDHPKTVLALPEVMLGLLPGGGGTQRLPRLIGLPKALPMLLTGKRIRARDAKRMGLVDALTAPAGFLETACRAAVDLVEGRLNPERDDLALPDRVAALGPIRGYILKTARESVEKKTEGLYPAPFFIVDCVAAGLSDGASAGYRKESELFSKLVVNPGSKNLIRLFDVMTELKKEKEPVEPRSVKKLAVLGAGLMGQGIAAVSLPMNPVVLKDVADSSLGGAARAIRQSLDKRVRSGALPRLERDQQWFGLTLTLDPASVAGADLVIEAVFEDIGLKRKVLAETEAHISAEAVYASNTSALPIKEIAAKAKHPERVLGMHYFSPVPKMPLLEIIRWEKTSPQALATARAYGQGQGKTVIVVEDGPGFYTTRILAPLLNEAILLLEEGAEVRELDRAMKKFGFPVGPCALMDEVGIDVAAHVSKDLGKAFEHRGLKAPASLGELFAAGYSGRKGGKGFYLYPRERVREKPVNDEVYRFFGAERRPVDPAVAAERMALAMVNEAIHCLGEEILHSPRDGDAGAILGLGFPPFLGGPFRYADSRGIAALSGHLEDFASRFGERFAPAPLLLEKKKKKKTFYPA